MRVSDTVTDTVCSPRGKSHALVLVVLPRTVGTVPGRAEVHNEVFVIAWRSQVHARAAALPESPELLRKYASASILQAVADKGHPMHDVSSARAVNVLHAHRAPPRVKQANTVCDPQTMMRKQRVADGIVYEFVAGMAHDAPLDCGRGQVFKTNRLWRKQNRNCLQTSSTAVESYGMEL